MQTLLVLLLLVVSMGCAPKPTRPWVDLQSINEQIARSPEPKLEQETGKEGGDVQSRSKDMSVVPPAAAQAVKDEQAAAPQQGDSGGILLNFDNADVYEFIQVISETLGINYIVDPKVKGTVNIRSGQKIGRDQLFGVFQKILNINGMDVRNEGDYYSIHPAKRGAPQQVFGPTESGSLKASSRQVVQVIPVVHLVSAEAVKLVEPYLSEGGVLHNLAAQNTLIVSDYESKVLDIVSVLSRLDISALTALKVRMVRVENAPLFTLRDELQEILTALTVNPQGHDAVSIVALERVNSLLLISKSDQLLDSTDRWIRELDVVPIGGPDTIHFYNVRNSVASELAALVNSIIGGEDGRVKTAGEGGAKLKTGLETGLQGPNFKGMTQDSSNIGSSVGQSSSLDSSNKSASPAKPVSLSSSAKPLQSGSKAGNLDAAGEPLLLADDSRNIILIRARASDFTRLVKLMERLDNLPRQVLIEVMVAEVTLNDSWQFGIEWALKNNKLKINDSQYAQKFATNFKDIISPTATTNGFAYSVLNSSGDIVALLNALAGETDVSLLSSPQILVLNNEEAFVNVGDQVPIVTSESVPLTSTDLRTSTIQYKDTGTILKVRPKINYDGMVLLDIDQQVSNAVENNKGGTTSPIISTRQIKTKLAVKNGQSIMMGGLIKKGNTNIQNKVPLLGDIPLLGWAFKYESQDNARTELLVMITPYVIESDDVLAQYIKKFEEKMQGLRQGLKGKDSAAAQPVKADKQGMQSE
ncbi:MAG: type II secretion system secretin GspD [Nanoarchaeota archaeon]|nr:type II secretion system secretin GspD [Nanoarchaeota archaeon]